MGLRLRRVPVGQSLSNNTTQSEVGARLIVNSDRNTVTVAEVELRQIPVQVLLADVVERPDDAALQDAEVAFDGVAVDVAANVLIRAMVNHAVRSELLADMVVTARRVRHEIGSAVSVLVQDRAQRLSADVGDMVGAGTTATLNQRMHDLLAHAADLRLLGPLGLVLVLLFAADVGRIGLKGRAFSAHRRQVANAHGFADTVGKEPSGLVLDLKGAVQLVGRDTLLATANEVDRLKPLVER